MMTEKKNKDFMRLLDLRVKPEDDRGGESGRSMVEMLGVLAVVGVLSVGSIAGYTYAMNKYYANELLAGASERAVLVAAQIASGRTPNLNEFANHTIPNGTFGEVKTDIEDGFGITVSGVKEAVCENLIKATDGTDVSIAKDDKTLSDVTCSGDENTFMFVFDYGVSGGTDENGGEPCGESDVEKCSGGQYYTCDDGKWVAHDLPTGTTCNGEEMECTYGATRCLNGQHQKCSGGWRDDDYDGCCVNGSPVEMGYMVREGNFYMMCCGGWNVQSCLDDSGKRIYPGNSLCVDGEYKICSSSGLVDDEYNDGCCVGNKTVDEGFRGCINSQYGFCSGGIFAGSSSGACCDGETLVESGSATCVNGQYKICSGSGFVNSSGACCNGETLVESGSATCVNGQYKICSGSGLVNSSDACCNGNEVYSEGDMVRVDGWKGYICQSGVLNGSCTSGAERCFDGSFWICEGSYWSQSGGCCDGDVVIPCS